MSVFYIFLGGDDRLNVFLFGKIIKIVMYECTERKC